MMTLIAERWPEPGKVALSEKKDGEVMRRFILDLEEAQQLGFDLCWLSSELLRQQREK
jgi:hypothetical protein